MTPDDCRVNLEGMTSRNLLFLNKNYYHIANFGIDGRLVFNDEKDVTRFISLLDYYRMKNPPARFAFRKRPIVRESKKELTPMAEILVYLLMPDHYHLIIKQTQDNGINNFMSKVSNSYTKFYNARQKRSGTLFKGPFKASEIAENELLNVSRYIHIEPLEKGLVLNLLRFPFSSMQEYMHLKDGFCSKSGILSKFDNPNSYKEFVLNQNEYNSTLPQIKELILE